MSLALVTGGAGFIGSHIVDALLAEGRKVRVVDNLVTGNMANLSDALKKIEFIQGDVRDRETAQKAVKGVDTIFHEAALASVPRSVNDPFATHEACATATVILLDEARRASVRRIVYAGSSSAYGNSAWASKRELDPLGPCSPYAAAKLAAELYCKAFYESYGLETVTLRYFNVFGPRQDPEGPYAAVIPKFIATMRAGNAPVIFGDGLQSRDFTFVDNVVAGNLAAAKATGVGGKTFNVATGKSYSLLQLVDMLNQILGTNFSPVLQPPRVGDVRDSLADTSNAQRELGYAPVVDFFDGLKRTAVAFQ